MSSFPLAALREWPSKFEGGGAAAACLLVFAPSVALDGCPAIHTVTDLLSLSLLHYPRNTGRPRARAFQGLALLVSSGVNGCCFTLLHPPRLMAGTRREDGASRRQMAASGIVLLACMMVRYLCVVGGWVAVLKQGKRRPSQGEGAPPCRRWVCRLPTVDNTALLGRATGGSRQLRRAT